MHVGKSLNALLIMQLTNHLFLVLASGSNS